MTNLFAIRSEDRSTGSFGFCLLALVMAGHAMMEAARDSLFLSRLPAERLPIAYLAIAALAVIVTRGNRALLLRFDKRRVLLLSLLIASAVTLGFRWALTEIGAPTLYALYVWSGLVSTVVVVQFWLLLADFVTVTQAKRVFSLVASGGLFGATLGSVAAQGVLQLWSAEELLLGAALFFASAGVFPFVVRPPTHQRNERTRAGSEAAGSWLHHPYLPHLLALVFVGTVAVTGADFLFKSVVAQKVPAEELPEFFAQFYVVLNLAGLVFQLFLAGRMLQLLGVSRALLVLPTLLVAVVLAMLTVPIAPLVLVMALKGADGSLRHSLQRTATEVLYLPLTVSVRDRFKGFIDTLGQRGGQAAASLLLLGVVSLAGPSGRITTWVAVIVGVVALLWVILALRIKGRYLNLFRSNLREGTLDTQIDLADLDLHSLEALVGALSSDDDDEVRASLGLFKEHQKAHLIPALVLYHPSREVVLQALELFTFDGRKDFVPVARRLLQHDDEEIRASALRAISLADKEADIVGDHLDDASPLVRVTAAVALASRKSDETEKTHLIEGFVRDPRWEVRAALANAIRQHRDRSMLTVLYSMASDTKLEVRSEVAAAMAAMPDEGQLPMLLDFLAFSVTRESARQALLALDEVGLYFLDEALYDRSLPRSIRRHIPRTIHRFPPAAACEVLVRHLNLEKEEAVRFKIVRAIGRLSASNPDLAIDRSAVEHALENTVRRAAQFLTWRIAAEREEALRNDLGSPGARMLRALLRERQKRAQEITFRLLGILHPREDFRLLYQGLRSRNRFDRASSRELLENSVTGSIGQAILALEDEGPAGDRLGRVAASLTIEHRVETYEQLLMNLLESSDDEATQSIAAYHIAELGLTDIQGRLEDARPHRPSYLSEVIDRALVMLDGSAPNEDPHAA